MIRTGNPGIREAVQEVNTMNLGRRLRLRYEAHLKQVRDENAWKAYEREEARKEGREEGLAEGRSQIIRNLIAQKVSDEDIIRLSGCSEGELETIKKGMASR